MSVEFDPVTGKFVNRVVDNVVKRVELDLLGGKDGVDGKDGKDGIDGKDGRDGIDGKDGRDGKDGKDGKDGTGISGISGKMDKMVVNLSDGTSYTIGIPRGRDASPVEMRTHNGFFQWKSGDDWLDLAEIPKQDFAVSSGGRTRFKDIVDWFEPSDISVDYANKVISIVGGGGGSSGAGSDGILDGGSRITGSGLMDGGSRI